MAAAVDSFHFLYREITRSCHSYFEPLVFVGALYATSKAVILLRDCCTLIRVHFIPRMIPTRSLSHRYGDWAVFNGASEAVAKAYAEELAKQGINIMFVSQEDHTDVADTAASISQTFGVESVVVQTDFTLEQTACKPIKEAIKGKDIGFLVNCVDESLTFTQQLIEIPEERLIDLLKKNIALATLMTRLVLPGMVERGRGAVVNISSAAGCRPSPGRVTLAASTKYLDHFSRALDLEYSSKGIFVQSLVPFQVASHRRHPPSSSSSSSSTEGWFVPRPEVYARHAVSTLGVAKRTTGYWPHTLQYRLMKCVPEWIWVLGSRALVSSS